MTSRKILPVGVFVIFCGIIFASTLSYSPGWGLMDDASNLELVDKFWTSSNKFAQFKKLIRNDLVKVGRFRVLNHVWTISVYKIFRNNPSALYVFIAVFCLSALLIWGMVIHQLFPSKSKTFAVFIYPLSFFIFTPFWNIFMYISTLEKFIFVFSGLSIYFFLKAYQKKKTSYLIFSFLFAFLGVFSKETVISLFIAYFAFSIMDLFLLKKNKKISRLVSAPAGIFFVSYYIFIKKFMGGYTAKYASQFNVSSLIHNVVHAPLFVKGLILLSIIALGASLIVIRKKSSPIDELFLLVPLFLFFYILILIPWEFSNYLLAPLAPLVLIVLYPLYLTGHSKRELQWLKNSILISTVFLLLFFLIMPRISKMADIRKMVSFISQQEHVARPRYFFPQPYFESAISISKFTEKEVIYLNRGVIEQTDFLHDQPHYLIFGDVCFKVLLKNVRVEEEVYSNKTWSVFSLKPDPGNNQEFLVRFPQTFIQKIKEYIKKLVI